MNRASPYLFFTALAAVGCLADEPIETVLVEGRQINLLGSAVSAAEGVVGQQEIQLRPLLRTGEVLELVPGMVVTQHSGTGKANQYFLRGFNLDHGTDFATSIDGMPVNMRSHGHGQGYTDLNFVIPESVATLSYKKGAYYADIGDFSGAGSAQLATANALEHGRASATLGEEAYLRLLAMDSVQTSAGTLLFAGETHRYDGPWDAIDEDLRKVNGLLKYHRPLTDGSLSLGMMAYSNRWNSADQIPQRAVEQGLITDLGSLDTTVGGESERYSVNVQWQHGAWQGNGYAIGYRMNLWSNFTYFLDDETNGDQFEQVDKRRIYGGELSYQWRQGAMQNRLGIQMRMDEIDEVGLYHTRARERLGVVRRDAITETSAAVFWENRTQWHSRWRSVIGVRYDHLFFDNTDLAGTNAAGVNLAANTGTADDGRASLKASVIATLSPQWEVYLSAGQGLHSNDARGATIQVDPADGSAATQVDPLVGSLGYETGLRGFIADSLNTSLSLWRLDLDSELLFVGDAGSTEASRASRRQGLELAVYYGFAPGWNLDMEYAASRARFTDTSDAGNQIPGAIEQVLQAGIAAQLKTGWFGSLRLRHFGERPLIEDDSVRSDASTVWNLRAGMRRKHWALFAEVLNLADSDAHDVDYYYASRLAEEASGSATEDIHYHLIEPRTLRVTASITF